MASSGKRKRNDKEDANDLTIDGINTIYVKAYTGETFSLQVKGSDRIISVKFMITDKIYYLPPDEQALIFNDMVLEDVITLADYRVKKNSTLTLMRRPGGLVPIFINDLNANYIYGKRRWPVNVKLSDTVGKLKSQISHLIYPHDPKELFIVFNDIVLDDCCILADFHITVDSVLTLLPKTTSKTMEIFVKTLDGKTISLDVIATTTIGKVKGAIRCQEYIPEDEKVLLFNEMVLDDSSSIFDFGIKKGSTLTLMRISKGLMQIFVNIDNRMIRSFQVKPSDTIANLKKHIRDNVGNPIDEQVLIFNEMILHDSGTLAEFDIKRESTLTLTRKSTGLMQIFVNTVTGMSTSIEVKPSDTVGNLKNQISDKVDIPIDKQVLIFKEMVLHDSGILADFHIKTESTLTVMRKSRGSMQIFVHDLRGRKISLDVNPLHTIANLKAMVLEKLGIPTQQLRLIFDRRCLEDSHTFADYNIQKDNVIHAELKLGGWWWGKGLKI